MPWPLRFGILIHDCMEELYKRLMIKQANNDTGYVVEYEGQSPKRTKVPFLWSQDNLNSWLEFCANLWRVGQLDAYSNLPAFKTLNGFNGFVLILIGYSEHYAKNYDKNNLKCVALEIGFGKNKEVPILEDAGLYSYAPFRLYLSGRLDYIFDDGNRIGPLDHKTYSRAGNPQLPFEVQEGMTGYCYAMTHMYKKLREALNFPESYVRRTDTVWMNHIFVPSELDPHKKFQRIPLYKTEYQLEQWRQRQISTVASLHQILFEGRLPNWNTSVCTNWYHGNCTYHPVHRLGSERDMFIILNSQFTRDQEVWNPER
jgi:hypothetical protein